MKATELMIGDWVGKVFDGYRIIEDYRQVDWIRTGEIGVRYQKVWSIGCIVPIPLTAEILEKNGFISYQQDRIVIWRNDYSFAIECDLTTWEYYWANGDVKINYVHELQHALRLCGLNDLADNFKI